MKAITINIAALLALGFASVADATQYSIIDLGTLGGLESRALDISPTGQVVGYSTLPDGNYRAFRWDGSIHDLGVANANEVMAWSVNSSNKIAGVGFNYGDLVSHAFSWLNGSSTPVGDFTLRSISDTDTGVGYMATSSSILLHVDHASIQNNGTVTDLGTLGGSFSYAYDISALGDVVGASFLADETTEHACLWHNRVPVDLGTLGGVNSQATGMNDAGKVIGWSETADGTPHAFMYSIGAAGNVTSRTDLGALPSGWSYAYGINNKNQVVGTSGTAFLWENGLLSDLNTKLAAGSGWVLASANAINDSGQIVGWGRNPEGMPHAYILLPLQKGLSTAKGLSDSTAIAVEASAVTAVFDGFFYVEDSSRTAGIRVVQPNHSLSIGQSVIVSGTAGTTSDGERFIAANVVTPSGTAQIEPMGMSIKTLGGGDLIMSGKVAQKGVDKALGLNNIGLLIRTAGKVTYVGSDYFYLSDGSPVSDDSGHLGVKVSAAGLALPAKDQVVAVTGISSCFVSGGKTYRLILARVPGGIEVIK